MPLRKCTTLFSRRCLASFGFAVRSLTEAFLSGRSLRTFPTFYFLHTIMDVIAMLFLCVVKISAPDYQINTSICLFDNNSFFADKYFVICKNFCYYIL